MRKTINTATLRALFARSGNLCAFPECVHPLINEKNEFIAQVCHIEAAFPKGERFNPANTDEENAHYSNLILLCYRHHVETNDVTEYTVQKLKDMKKQHEDAHAENPYIIASGVIEQIKTKINAYWILVEELHANQHRAPDDVKMQINTKASFVELYSELNATLSGLSSLLARMGQHDRNLNDQIKHHLEKIGYTLEQWLSVPSDQNPFIRRWLDAYCYSIPNRVKKMQAVIAQLEILHCEALLLADPNNAENREHLRVCGDRFKEIAQTLVRNE